jgi:hypothetical protein
MTKPGGWWRADNYKVLMVKSGNKKTQRNLIKKVCLEGYCTSLGD